MKYACYNFQCIKKTLCIEKDAFTGEDWFASLAGREWCETFKGAVKWKEKEKKDWMQQARGTVCSMSRRQRPFLWEHGCTLPLCPVT